MKQLGLILTIYCVVITQTIAEPVSEQTARQVAVNWYLHYAPVEINTGAISIDEVLPFSADQTVDFYVVAFDPGGFVIVSGDNATIPVIGFSHDSPVQPEISHPAVDEFFANLQAQLQWVSSEGIDNTATVPLWRGILDKTIPLHDRARDVAPLLSTTWDQGCGYNDDCPIDGGGPCGHVWAGCVATAMAQVMRYWAHPLQGVGSHGYIHPDYGYQYADFNATNYNWAGMPDNVGSEDIAELLYHCGVALEMDYGPDGSGAYTGTYGYPNVVSVLEDYFNYQLQVDYLYKSDYSDSVWNTLLQGQLDLGWPLVYRGEGSGGHAFVCDGYQGDNYFHFNWGWSGTYDGYFYLNDLTPGGHEFTTNQGAVFNIVPNEPVIPDPVDDLTITLQENDVVMEWSAVVGADAYNIYRLLEPYDSPGMLLSTSVGTTYTSLNELQFQSRAFFVVTVVYDAASHLFDHFVGPFNDEVWMWDTNGGGYIEVLPDSSLVEIHSGTGVGGGTWIQSLSEFTIRQDEGRVFSCRSRVSSNDGGLWGFFGGHEAEILFKVSESGDLLGLCRTENETQIPLSFSGNLDNWHVYRVQATADLVEFYVDYDLVGSIETNIPVNLQMRARLDRVSNGIDEILYVDYVGIY